MICEIIKFIFIKLHREFRNAYHKIFVEHISLIIEV